MSAALHLLRSIDDLYRRAVTGATTFGDDDLAGWLAEVSAGLEPPVDGVLTREAAKAARRARRIARYWAGVDRDPDALPDWRNGVDEALGGSAWEPSLAVARRGLEIDPGPEVFEATRDLFRTVHFQPWMEGISFEEYLAAR